MNRRIALDDLNVMIKMKDDCKESMRAGLRERPLEKTTSEIDH